jgi:hypothetical protein
MNSTKRTGNRWTINELLSLQREYELLELSIVEISLRHQRTPNAIMFKLDNEGFADYNTLYINYYKENNSHYNKGSIEYSDDDNVEDNDDVNDEDYVDADDEDYVDADDEDEDEYRLAKRVYKLENSLDEIKNMLKSIISNSGPSCGIKDCKMSSCSNL